MSKKLIIFPLSLFFIDQCTKWIAVQQLNLFYPFTIIPNIFSLQLVYNYGAAYGILQNQRLFLLIVGTIVIIGGFVFSKKIISSAWSCVGLCFLLGGACGNVFDRFRLGYVVDFIDIRIFPVFNFADVFIDIAIACFLIELIFYDKKKIQSKKS